MRCELPATYWSTGTARGVIGPHSIDTDWPWWRPWTPWATRFYQMELPLVPWTITHRTPS